MFIKLVAALGLLRTPELLQTKSSRCNKFMNCEYYPNIKLVAALGFLRTQELLQTKS